MEEQQIFQHRTDLTDLSDAVLAMRQQIKKIIVGQDEMVRLIITALLTDGHVLIEGVPGVAKTLTANTISIRPSMSGDILDDRELHRQTTNHTANAGPEPSQ